MTPLPSRLRPMLERLEAREVPTVLLPTRTPGPVTIIGTDNADQFVIRAAPTGGLRQMLQFSDNGGRTFTTKAASAVTDIIVQGQAGNDRLTLDQSLGFIGRSQGLAISYQAGYNGVNEFDELVLRGDPGNLVHTTYAADSSGAGRLEISDDLRSLSVKFSPLASITDTMPGTSLSINGTSGNDLIQILDGAQAEGLATTRLVIGGTAFDFANTSKLYIDAGAGDDVFRIDSTTPAAGLFSIVLEGGDGVDGSIHVNDPVPVWLNNIEWSERTK